MCGIVGLVNIRQGTIDGNVLETMTSSLSHRGPDGTGIEMRKQVGFGHRRLAIIDPDGGRQPIFNEDGQVWVTFNGEIYNFKELRKELESNGHHFKTDVDSEVIVHGYEQWGERCVEHFRGMFAFAVMDWRELKLFLARDQFGIKPLYYVQTGDHFAFASELHALRYVPDLNVSLDLTAIDEYLWLQYIPAPHTVFDKIYKLPPAHSLSVRLDGETKGPVEYWRIEFNPDHTLTEGEWIERIDEVVEDSVKAHLVSDVPFGAFLSGGVNSSLVIAHMTQALGRPVSTFSIGFEKEEFNEDHFAWQASARWGTNQYMEIVQPDALAILPELVRHYGEPFGDSSAIPTFYVSQVARKHVPMVLSGDGADELFAGNWSYGHWLSSLWQSSTIADRVATLNDWLVYVNYINPAQRSSLWKPDFASVSPSPLEQMKWEFGRTRGFSPCNKAQYMDLKSYMPYDILTKVDIASMMHGLEVRTPFVDVRVAECAAQIPEVLNIGSRDGKEWSRKLLLKKVAEKYYPKNFLHRPKMGFAMPLEKWFHSTGHLHAEVRERLLGKNSSLNEFFNAKPMSLLLSQNAHGPVWLLLFLEEWLRANKGFVPQKRDVPEIRGSMRDETIALPSRRRIMFIADEPGSALTKGCAEVIRQLQERFDCSIGYKTQPYFESEYDLVVHLDRSLVVDERVQTSGKYLIVHLEDLLNEEASVVAAKLRQILEEALSPDAESQPKSIDDVKAAADDLFSAGKFQEAREKLLDALAVQPDDASLILSLGNLHFQMGEMAAARKEFQKVTYLFPDNSSGHSNLAAVYVQEGEIVRAEQSLRKALELQPDDADALRCLARLYLDDRQYERSLTIFDKVLALQPDDIDSRFAVAAVHFEAGRIDAAKRMLNEVLRYQPDNTAALETLEKINTENLHVQPRDNSMELTDTPIRVLIFYDEKGWAWWHRARHIKNNISKDFQIEITKVGVPFDHHQYDFVLLFDHYLLSHIGKVPSGKVIIGNSCPRFLAESVKAVMENRCAGGVVNNLASYQKALEYTDKYFCCQNGVDERLFHPAEKKVKELIACWVGNSKSIGNKGLEIIQQACQLSGVRLRIVDAADKEQGVEANPQEWVRDQLYHKSSVYICASEFEGAPNPALEAMACGLPVISTRVGNMVELIKDGYNGFLVERSPEAIATALQKLRKSDFHTMGKNARTSIENGWTWAQQVTKYETMFKELRKHPHPEVDQILAQVQELREQDEHGQGLRILEGALQHDPHDERLLVVYAELLLESGAREKAKNTLLQLLEHHPNSLDGMNDLAVIEIMDAEMVEAKKLLEKVLQADRENETAKENLRYLDSLQEHKSLPKEADAAKTTEGNKTKGRQAYARAQRLIEAGNIDEAISALQALLKLIPGHAQAMNDLGALFFAQGNLQDAREYLAKARDLDPSNVVTLKNLAELATHEDHLDEAAACYQEILDVDPEDIEALVAAGLIALAITRYDNAEVFFTRALEVDPENREARKGLEEARANPLLDVKALEERAKLLVAKNKIGEAAEIFRQITEQEPPSSDVYYNLGLCYCKLQQRSQAIDALVKAVELDPRNPTKAKALVRLLVEEGMYEEGIRLLASILRYAPDDVETVLSLAQLYEQAGRGNDACVFYERVLTLDPENEEAHAYLHEPEVQSPEEVQQVIERDPKVHAHLHGAEEKFDAGDFVGARDELVTAINLAPYDAELLTISGNVHLKLGEVQQAAGIYARATQVDPFFAPAHYSLALLLQDSSPDQAASSARRVLDIDSSHVGASKILAETLMSQKKHAESISALFSYLRHAESGTGAMLGLARAFQELGEAASARSLYEEVLKIVPDNASARNGLSAIKEKPRVNKSPKATAAHEQPRFYLAMLTHNALAYTQKSFESIERTTNVPYRIIVVDNGSTDGTPAWLSQQDNAHLFYELSETNLGVPGGRNRLLEIALRDLPDDGFIIFVDNDMEFFPGWAEHYLDFFNHHPEAGIVSAVGHRFIVKKDKRELLPKPLRAEVVDVACGGYGCCMRASVVKAVGDFDTQLGLFWHEDDDYSVRAIEKGFEVYALPSAPIVHHRHKSGVANPGIAEGGSLKNQKYLVRKWRTMGIVDGRGRIDHSRVQTGKRTKRVIGVDARTFFNIDSVTRGIGHYSLYHLTALAEEKPDWEFVLYGTSDEVPEVLEKLCNCPNVNLRAVTTFRPQDVDLVHLCDPMDVNECSPFKVFQNIRTSVTFYDLIPLKMYISHWTEQVRKTYLERLKELAGNATRVLAISDFTKVDLAAQTQIDPARIHPIMAGINASTGMGRISKSRVQALLNRHGITKPFFLHVGALDLHKNFDSVLRAFLECSRENDVQLVVVGRLQNFVKVYADYVKTQRIENVLFTDFISREDLEVLYSEAVALVFASLHEGFGFPVLEAMANGCPVISSNATSLPEVAGDAAILFDPKDVRNISRAMSELLQSPQRRDEMIRKGREQSAKFTWKQTAQKTIAVWNELLGPAASKTDQPKVAGGSAEICFSAALDYSGYSFLARSCTKALMLDGVDVSFEVIEDSEDFEKSLARDPDASAMWKSLTECDPGTGLKVCVHPPTLWNGTDFYSEFRRKAPRFTKYVGLTMFETDRLPKGWAESCNKMDEIWVPSTFNQQTFVLGGVEKNRVKVLPLGLDAKRYDPEQVSAMKIKGKKGFAFLSVFQWSDRKGWDILLRAYLSGFNQRDDVSLILRSYRSHGSTSSIKDEVHRFVLAAGYDPQCIPSIIVLDEFIDEADMPSLYRAADAYVMPTRGEGWGIPFMEAMASGLPVIGTRWGGHLDFMTDENSYLIDIDGLTSVSVRQAQENPFYEQDHCWVEPSVENTADLMRHVFDDRKDGIAKGLRAREDIVANWSMDRTTAWLKGRLNDVHSAKPVQEKVTLPAKTQHPVPTGVPLLWHAPVYNPSGYADEARNFILQLEASGVPVALRSISIHSQSFYDGYDEQARNILDGSLNRKIGNNYINVIHFPGYAFEKLPAASYNIGRTMFETDSLPEEWVRACNAMDEIWVPSDFNMETFRNAGVRSKLVKIPGGVDTWHFRDGLPPLEIPGVKGTVFLSVFEWIYRKGWDVLLKAWARAFTVKDDVCLVLRAYPMNGADHGDSPKEIENRIRKFLRGQGLRRNTLAPIIVLGDQISENDLPRLYAAASAYVAPSRGEGWGRPQMEAMACGLPVIATRWSGNLEFMNDDNSLLLDAQGLVTIDDKCEIPFYRGQRWAEPSVKHLVHLLQRVVQAPEEVEKLGARARQDMEAHWRWEEVTKKVRQRLREIQGGNSQDKRAAIPIGLPGVRWEGSQFVHHSLAVINRNVCSRLIAAGYPVSIIPYEPDEFKPEGDALKALAMRVQAPLDHVDVHVRHQWPPDLSPPDRGKWVVIQPWEFGSLPRSWVEVFATQVDEMWVPSTYVRQVYVDSGVPADRVVVIPNGFDPTVFHPGVEPYRLKTEKKFKFLFVGGTIFRKGIDILIDAYLQGYSRKDDVCLVIKDMGGKSFYKGQTMKEQIAAIRKDTSSPEIEYIDKTLTTEQLAGLYVTCDVLVHPYRGEGFGMPILEAMACGTPPIVTNGGAALDFCSKENSIPVKARRMNYPENKVEHFDTVNTPWLYEVEPGDLAKAMKFAVRNHQAVRVLGTQAAHDALRFTWDGTVVKIRERVEQLRSGEPLRDQLSALQENPVEDAYLLAIANYQNAHYQESLNYLEVASTLIHDQGLSHDSITAFDVSMRKGDCMLKMGMLQEAKEEYEQALKIRPESAEACFNLGLCLELSGRMDGAIVMYEFAVSLNPKWSEANEKLSDCQRKAEGSLE